ncbi:peptide chain release factor 1 [Candidatus Liberibacter africanus]|uniref:Peptide chain release factor 1 n=1 Tax=Candidatus Liberibacter africanus PTSAPSY TaxID=1277257 RepID=A0A0G3I5M5_LIBAF|nr:peptide chain release factor 1 [Candidatus Liberibacter africanus]AKK19768.1 peptide chain release factor 1 [Candidatus Liberibacter africanus PTSAPSY]
MVFLSHKQICDLKNRFSDIEKRMSESPSVDVYIKLTEEYAAISPVITKIDIYEQKKREEQDLRTIINDNNSDSEIRDLAQVEILDIEKEIKDLECEISYFLLPKDIDDDKSCILEIRAGTGGSEAALFVGDLFRMYERYAAFHKWKVEVLSSSDNDDGGYKEIIATISGCGVFSRMKFESGVHRVQRVPATETNGRIHTSAATVAVLPEAKEIDVDIAPEDIRIDTMRASGAGGQHVNTTDSAVRITHIPTGIMVTSSEKSQHQNRLRAMKVLRARLYHVERKRMENERSANRKSQIGTGDRSERIRTYNFPQGRITDHRINLTLYKLEYVLQGYIDEIINALITAHQAKVIGFVSE